MGEIPLSGRRILLIISGGIAAYKSLDLIRRLRERGAAVRCVLTEGGARFITPLAAAALAEEPVYTDLFSLKEESEMGHIRLSREADVILVAPATADILAKMAHGLAGDLASTVLLATDKPVLVAPSMNTRMWSHAATQANLALLRARGIGVIGPADGDLACGEIGSGRMSEPLEIAAALIAFFRRGGLLAGRHAVVTSGPTHEPIDPVRYIGNRSSGKQGHAIAAALAEAGARVTLVTGPVALSDPPGVATVHVETAREMETAVRDALPADIAVMAAAVADWTVETPAGQKLKKREGEAPPSLTLGANPDILAGVARLASGRPRLVIGFAAETEDVIANAVAKRARKGCDWILANDVSPGSGVFGGDRNTIHLVTAEGVEDWPPLGKSEIAARLALRIADTLGNPSPVRS